MGLNDELVRTIGRLTDSDLISLVGPAAFALGTTTFENGEVAQVDVDSYENRIQARVKAGALTYTCWIEPSAATVTRVELTCACRTARRCRHAVAALLWVRASVPAPEVNWTQILARLERSPQTGDPLAVCLKPSGGGVLTPMRRGRSGQWTTRRASWRDLTNRQWDSVTDDLDGRQLAAMRSLYQLCLGSAMSEAAGSAAVSERWQPTYGLPAAQPSPSRSRAAGDRAGQSREVSVQALGASALATLQQLRQSGVSLLVETSAARRADVGQPSTAARRSNAGQASNAALRADVGQPSTAAAKLPGSNDDLAFSPQPEYLPLQLSSTPAIIQLVDAGETGGALKLEWVVKHGDAKSPLQAVTIFEPGLVLLDSVLVELDPTYHDALQVARDYPVVEVPVEEAIQLHQMAGGPLSHVMEIADPEPDTLIATLEWKGDRGRVRWLVEISEGGVLRREDFKPTKHARVKHSKMWLLMWAVSEGVDYRIQPMSESFFMPAGELVQAVEHSIETTEGYNVIWETSELPDPDDLVTAELSLNIRPAQGENGEESTDWFDVETIVQAQGQRLKLGQVIATLAAGRNLIRSEDGVWVRLDAEDFSHLRDILESLSDRALDEAAPLQVSCARLAAVAGAAELGWDATWEGQSAQFAQQLQYLRQPLAADPLRVAPKGAQLRPYQESAVAWLLQLRALGFGGILADDMGLGKTMQILSFVATVQKQRRRGPVLVCAPTSVVSVWEREAARFFPGLRVAVVRSTSAKANHDSQQWQRDYDLVVTSWALVRLDRELYQQVQWEGVVLDEAQMVKNSQTQTHSAVRGLERNWVVAVTGTPIENSISDLWSILALTNPGLLPGRKRFLRHYAQAVERRADANALDELLTLIMPFIRRRTKAQVASELPQKTDQVIGIDLDAGHRQVYERALTAVQRQLVAAKGDEQQWGFLLAALTKLRLLALDPALVSGSFGDSMGEDGDDTGKSGAQNTAKSRKRKDSAKTRYLVSQLEQLRESGHRALVFSQFTSYLERLAQALDQANISYCYLDGATRQREKVIERFRSGDETAFLLSLKAGGTGLTLTEADYVFLMDPWWNPAVEQQAVDRTHRIGQVRAVNVYRLYGNDTIEEKVLALQDQKRELVERVFDGAGKKLSYRDMASLLGK